MTATDGRWKRPRAKRGVGATASGKSPRPEDKLHVELWYGIFRPVLADLLATISVLVSLQVLYFVVERLYLPEWFKEAFHLVHEYGSLAVGTLLVIGFISRILIRIVQEIRHTLSARSRAKGRRGGKP